MKNQTLLKLVSQIHGVSFGQLITETTPILKGGKKNPYQGRITKKTNQNVQIGTDYEKAVNRQAARENNEESFSVSSLPKGREWVIPKKVLKSKNGLLLRYTVQNHKKPKVEYFLDGEPIEKSKIEHMLPQSYDSKKQKELGNTVQVRPRDVLASNIISLKINHKVFS